MRFCKGALVMETCPSGKELFAVGSEVPEGEVSFRGLGIASVCEE